MHLRTELAAIVAGFLALNFLLVFTAIGLFLRMGPAIERILQRNDATIVAAERILATFARHGAIPTDAATRADIDAALQRARNNITEPGEGPILATIEGEMPAALAGDAAARVALIGHLDELIAVNRAAMRQVDTQAQRMGTGGAWAAAFVGLASLGLGFVLTRRLGRRVVRPLQELESTLAAALGGDPFRRASTTDAAPELRTALENVNHVLDRSAAVGVDERRFANP